MNLLHIAAAGENKSFKILGFTVSKPVPFWVAALHSCVWSEGRCVASCLTSQKPLLPPPSQQLHSVILRCLCEGDRLQSVGRVVVQSIFFVKEIRDNLNLKIN